MQIPIDLSQDLEQALLRQAAQANVPLQTLIVSALRQLTQPVTKNYLGELAKRGNREQYETVLANVPDVEPKLFDQLLSA